MKTLILLVDGEVFQTLQYPGHRVNVLCQMLGLLAQAYPQQILNLKLPVFSFSTIRVQVL